MKVHLHIQQGRKPSRTLTLRGPEIIFGRAHGNAVRIPSNDVSRKHCRLLVEGDKVSIEDLESLNGTYLNSKPIEGVREVIPGDHIRVGPITFVIDFSTEEADSSASDEEERAVADDLVDVTLVDAPPPRHEPSTSKGATRPGNRQPAGQKSGRKPPVEPGEIDEDTGLVPLEEIESKQTVANQDETPVPLPGVSPPVSKKKAKPAPPPPPRKPPPARKEADDKMIPLVGDPPRTEPEASYVEFDQAWSIPPSGEIRTLLQGLEQGETVCEEDKPKNESGT